MARKEMVFDEGFVWFLGAFFGTWATLELVTSYAIGKFLNISDEEAHILTSGMEFGRKSTLLRNLAHRSADPKRKEIIGTLGKIQNESKRNVFAHAFIISGETMVTFIDRTRGGDYLATMHAYTPKGFSDHVIAFGRNCAELETLLGVTKKRLHTFAMAALSANTKSTKSPVPPSSKA